MEWEGVTYRIWSKSNGVTEGAGFVYWYFEILTWDKRYPRVGGGGRRCDECDVHEFRRVEGPFKFEEQASQALQSKLDKWRG